MGFYRLALAPLGLLFALALAPFIPKLKATLKMRQYPPQWPEWVGHEPTLWVHCASGEFEYAKAVLREWRKLKPQHKIFVSYFSPSYQRAIEASDEVDFSAPLPLDLPGPMAQFIKKIKPELLAVARTDLWPEMCAQAARHNISITLFSATRRPLRWWEFLVKPLIRWRLELVDQILTVSELDVAQIKNIGVRTPQINLGDSRYDQVVYRLAHPKKLTITTNHTVPVLAAGSTWKEDETVLLEAIFDLLKKQLLRLILVPHEPTPAHLHEIQKRLEKQNITYQLYSTTNNWQASVLLVDQVGILAELYTLGNMAFVGGSFKGSVHSVMEPLACGLPTFVGPYHLNNREACEFQNYPLNNQLTMVNMAKNSVDLKNKIELLLKSDLSDLKEKIRVSIRVNLGAARKIAETLCDTSIG